MMDGWNLLQFKTKIGKKARQKCMIPRQVPKTPKYPLYLKIIAENSMPRVKPTNAKMSSIPILQYWLGGENTSSQSILLPGGSVLCGGDVRHVGIHTCKFQPFTAHFLACQLTNEHMHSYYCNQLKQSNTNQEDTIWAKDTEDSCHDEVFSFPVEEVDVQKKVYTC